MPTLDQNTIILLLLALAGLVLIVVGFKFTDTTRKVIETLGAVILHIGVFGILYQKVSLTLFLSLVTFVVALFLIIDPLKLAQMTNDKIYKLVGWVMLFVSVGFSLDHFSGFPVWLWTIPLLLYLIPSVIVPLKKLTAVFLSLAWLTVIGYIVLIAYVIYGQFNPSLDTEWAKVVFPKLKVTQPQNHRMSESEMTYSALNPKQTNPKPVGQEKTTMPSPLNSELKNKPQLKPLRPLAKVTPKKPAVPLQPEDGFLKSLDLMQTELNRLRSDYQSLKRNYDALMQEHERLKNQQGAGLPVQKL